MNSFVSTQFGSSKCQCSNHFFIGGSNVLCSRVDRFFWSNVIKGEFTFNEPKKATPKKRLNVRMNYGNAKKHDAQIEECILQQTCRLLFTKCTNSYRFNRNIRQYMGSDPNRYISILVGILMYGSAIRQSLPKQSYNLTRAIMKVVFKLESRLNDSIIKCYVTSIGVEEMTYVVPLLLQPIKYHGKLSQISSIKSAVKSLLTKAGKYRNIKIDLSEDLKQFCFDEEGSPTFNGIRMAKLDSHQNGPKSPTFNGIRMAKLDSHQNGPKSPTFNGIRMAKLDSHQNGPKSPTFNGIPMAKLDSHQNGSNVEWLEIIANITEQLKIRPNANINDEIKNICLNKYDGKSDINLFLNRFELECSKHGIQSDEEKIGVLKFFLGKSPMNLYDSIFMKIGKNNWDTWKELFKEAFGFQGWGEIRLAYQYAYQSGRYIDYALKKENLLLNLNEKIAENVMIHLIVIGLPIEAQKKINRRVSNMKILKEEIQRIDSLYESFNESKVESPQTTNR
ncbi:hypothetical protein BLOT_012775 [Blomia tropicalis]|nr:hypothetical protein BLOT_012775 [Blomia tropicalis]